MEGSDAKLLATSSNVLSSQHGSVGRGLVTVSLDLHTTSDTADGFATTISNASAVVHFHIPRSETGGLEFAQLIASKPIRRKGRTDLRSVTCTKVSLKEAKIRATPKVSSPAQVSNIFATRRNGTINSPSPVLCPRDTFSVAGRWTCFLGAILTALDRGCCG